MAPTITEIESTEFSYSIEDLGYSEGGFSLVYEHGSTIDRTLFGLRIHTDVGITGEYIGGNSPGMAE